MDIEGLLYKLKINIVTNLNIKEADRLELGNDIFEIEKQVKSALSPVSGILPNNFKQLPEKLQCKLVRKHTYAELVDGEKIVYEEQDLLDIIKYVSEGNYR